MLDNPIQKRRPQDALYAPMIRRPLPQHGLNRSRIVNLGLREQLCHLLSMGVPDVAVRPEDELAAVLMSQPRGRAGE